MNVVGSNPSTGYWMDIFHKYLFKNCNICLKSNEKEAGHEPSISCETECREHYLKGECHCTYCWPVYFVWIQLLCLCWISISLTFFGGANPKQSMWVFSAECINMAKLNWFLTTHISDCHCTFNLSIILNFYPRGRDYSLTAKGALLVWIQQKK